MMVASIVLMVTGSWLMPSTHAPCRTRLWRETQHTVLAGHAAQVQHNEDGKPS